MIWRRCETSTGPEPYQQRAGAGFGELLEGVIDIAGAVDVANQQLLPYRCCGVLHVAPLGFVVGRIRIDQHRHRFGVRHEPPQQFQPLGAKQPGEKIHAGDIAAGPVHAGDQPVAHRIAAGGKHDRHRSGGILRRQHRHRVADEDADRAMDQFSQQGRQAFRLIFRRSELKPDVLPVDEAFVLQALAECGDPFRCIGERRGTQEADHRRGGLLRARSQRPGKGCDTTEKFAPSHGHPC
jgi:hypothetical protein